MDYRRSGQHHAKRFRYRPRHVSSPSPRINPVGRFLPAPACPTPAPAKTSSCCWDSGSAWSCSADGLPPHAEDEPTPNDDRHGGCQPRGRFITRRPAPVVLAFLAICRVREVVAGHRGTAGTPDHATNSPERRRERRPCPRDSNETNRVCNEFRLGQTREPRPRLAASIITKLVGP